MEEVSAAGWNASGRGGAAPGGGDSRLEAGTEARTRAAMPHFTVVPVDGPRRGDYDNLEGLSWVDYGERAEREDSDGEGAPGRGRDWGRLHGTRSRRRTAREHVHAGLHFSCSTSAQTDESSRSGTPELSHPPPARTPSSSPESRGRGLQTWPPGEAGQQAASLRMVPNARPGPGPGSTEAWIAASSLSVNRPHPLESYPFFPCDSPPLSCPPPTPALWPGRSEGCAR